MAGYKSLLDMFDGGGAGASGAEFKGGLLSGLLNDLGVKPVGYQDRLDAMQTTRPQLRPMQPQQTQPMQYGGRGNVGMPSRPMQGSGMTPANAYQPASRMTVGTPIPVSQAITPDQLRAKAMQLFPGLDESQAQQRMYAHLMQMGGM